METPLMHQFDLNTGEYAGSRPAQIRPNGKPVLESVCAVPVAPPDVPEGHAARWTGQAWEVVEDHRQKMDERGRKYGGMPYWLPAEGDGWQSPERYMDTLGPLPEGAATQRPPKPDSGDSIQSIDSETSAAIRKGFDYTLDGEPLHFPYDEHDQQNFADNANAALLSKIKGEGQNPCFVPLNAYRPDGTLIRLALDADAFLALYNDGALKHKAEQLKSGRQRKAALDATNTETEVPHVA